MDSHTGSTAINETAKNPNGQRGTMAGAPVGTPGKPMDLHSSKDIAISPTSTQGYRPFDKQ